MSGAGRDAPDTQQTRGAKHDLTLRVVSSLDEVEAAAWDACANPADLPYDPFVSHTFLKALEDAGCVGPSSGWLPQHLLAVTSTGRLAAVVPSYLKSHSRGEYIFDDGWAEAYERAGGAYYPKLQCAVPFTPVPGRRLLVADATERQALEPILASALAEVTRQLAASSYHVTFLSEDEWRRLGAIGLLQRTGKQFHWQNRGYRSFDDFLATLASRKRKALKRERREALASGIEIEWLTGRDITEAHWDAFFAFYMDTGSRKWGRPYLNRAFFSLLGERMAEHCLLVMAKRDGGYIAGALNMIGGDCLFGRYWGAVEHHPFLHFEVCYYQAIDFAIAQGLERVEAGAQGEHKLLRGYEPVLVYSVHYIPDTGFRRAVANYLERERHHVEEEREILSRYGPYRRDGERGA